MHLATYLSEVNTLVLGRLVFYLVFFPYSVIGLHSSTKSAGDAKKHTQDF